MLSSHFINKITHSSSIHPKYNFEYFLNRGYVLNRDRGNCKICGVKLNGITIEFHHINERLPLKLINRVPNLASVCKTCHELVHSNEIKLNLSKPILRKLNRMREKLNKVSK
ncbi:HNH endonuclease [Desulfofarcimen acetoxidans]|uniref:HNH endonuclease n=1 Tax=Desulfofarcimen acetoxidans TaxID=58138 RepID=UPI0012FEFE4F